MRVRLGLGLVWMCSLTVSACLQLDKRAQENLPPIADVAVTPGLIVVPGERVNLDGAASVDPEGQALGYTWQQLSGELVFIENAGAAQATFLAPERTQFMTFSLTVSDGRNSSEPKVVQVRVATNTPPRAALGPPSSVAAGTLVTLDASGSSDAETPVGLSFRWRCTSHPEIGIADGAVTTMRLPSAALTQVTVEVTVSDGELTSSATVSFETEATDATHWFVDAAAGCGTGCAGTREAPYADLQSAIDAATAQHAAGEQPKPVLVAAGFYESIAIDAPVALHGGCDPAAGWRCGDGLSVIEGAEDEQMTIALSDGTAAGDGARLTGFTVFGPNGQAANGIDTGNGLFQHHDVVHCNGCRMSLDNVTLVGAAAGTSALQTVSLYLLDTEGPVRVSNSSITTSRGSENYGVFASGVRDVELTGTRIVSADSVRQGVATNERYNALVFVRGDRYGVTVDGCQLEVNGGGDYRYTHAFGLRANKPGSGDEVDTVVVRSSLIWFRGFATRWADGTGGPGVQDRRNEANNVFFIAGTQTVVVTGNTILGTQDAKDASDSTCLSSGYDEACLGSIVFMTEGGFRLFASNNYVESFNTFVWNDSSYSRHLNFKANTLHDVVHLVDGATVEPVIPPPALSEPPSHLDEGYQFQPNGAFAAPDPLGADNQVANCLLENAATGNVRLLPGSPCIDTGVIDRRVSSRDLLGNPRARGVAVDRGAVEVQP